MKENSIKEDIKEMYQWDGKTYAVPKDIDTIAMWYNKDMFDEAGIDYPDGSWTWDEFYDIAEKLTKEDGSQYGFAANPSNEQDTWMNIVYSMGGCAIAKNIALGGYAQGHIAIGDVTSGEFCFNTINNSMRLANSTVSELKEVIKSEFPNTLKIIQDIFSAAVK